MAEAITAEKIDPKHMLVAAAAIGGLIIVLSKVAPAVSALSEYDTFPVSNFFQPSKVTELAASFDAPVEDDFILNAWNWVGTEITYESVPSDIEFLGNIITCLYCYTVEETLARGIGNCVNKSALLASILLNRLSTDRVYMIIGGYSKGGTVGGHAWLNVYRNGEWYLVEATSPPQAQPWIPVSGTSEIYLPYATFSAQTFQCVDHSICLKVGACGCGRGMQEW